MRLPLFKSSQKITAVFCLLFFFTASLVFAQNKPKADSIFFKLSDTVAVSKNVYLHSVEKANQILNAVQADAEPDWELFRIRQQSVENRQILRTLRNVLNKHTDTDFRNVRLYRSLLTEIKEDNQKNQQILEKAEQKIESAKQRMKLVSSDTILLQWAKKSAGDTSRRRMRPLKMLQKKWLESDSIVSLRLDSLTNWSAMVTMNNIMVTEMLRTTDKLMRESGKQIFHSNSDFLFKNNKEKSTTTKIKQELASNATDGKEVLNYYIQKNAGQILYLPVIFIILLNVWFRRIYKRVKTSPVHSWLENGSFNYINRSRFFASVILVLSVLHVEDIYAPWGYLLLVQILITLATAVLFWQKHTKEIFYTWLSLIVSILFISIINSVQPGFISRCALILINGVCIINTVSIIRKSNLFTQQRKLIKTISVINIILNVLAILFNIFGKVTLAQVLSSAAIIALTQILTLSIFKQLILEVILLHLTAVRVKQNILKPFDYETIKKDLEIPTLLLMILLWTIMFIANLNLYEGISTKVISLLTSPIHIGSASFTIESIVLFFIIVWLAHLLQRYIGYFFGETGNEEEIENKKSRSRMVITKLVVICIGYFLAVSASGLPLDKITIVLGALGVGIGLGLQNIVNNLVSGIILIFDRPLQIGDTIDVNGNSGRVKEIGVRSSTLLTAEGAEVIIPNGDILSHPITNWTLTDSQKRLEIEFKIATAESKDTIMDLVKKSLLSAKENVVTEREPLILFENAKENEVNLNVFFWCRNVNKSDWVKSEVRYLIYGTFRENGINVL